MIRPNLSRQPAIETIWFKPGMEHRHTGKKSLWAKKPLRVQLAIILAANHQGGDWWELIKSKAQERYLAEAEELIRKDSCKAGEEGQERDLRAA